MTQLPWSGSSCRRSAATVGFTRKATATPSSGCSESATARTREVTFVELPRAGRRRDPPQLGVALAVPAALSRRRALACHGGDEQRVSAPAPGARPAARRQVRLHVLSRRPVVLLLPRPDRDRRLPDVLLR